MKRLFFLSTVSVCFAWPLQLPPIKVEVGTGKTLTITVTRMAKDQLIDIVATFFARDRKSVKADLESKFQEASEVTLVLTSK
jgi:hypothetical protein